MVRPSVFRRLEVGHQRIPPGLRHREFGGESASAKRISCTPSGISACGSSRESLAALPGCVDQYGALLKQVRIVCPIGDEAAGL